jgi:succinate dehydrogenase hydrophobic anchor subunit
VCIATSLAALIVLLPIRATALFVTPLLVIMQLQAIVVQPNAEMESLFQAFSNVTIITQLTMMAAVQPAQ